MLLNCDAEVNAWESLGLQGDQTSHSYRKSTFLFFGRTDAEAEAPIFWPPDVNNQLIGKAPDAGKDWGYEEFGATGWDDWMALLIQWAWALANSRRRWGTGSPVCSSPKGVAKSQTWLGNQTTTMKHNFRKGTKLLIIPCYLFFFSLLLKIEKLIFLTEALCNLAPKCFPGLLFMYCWIQTFCFS